MSRRKLVAIVAIVVLVAAVAATAVLATVAPRIGDDRVAVIRLAGQIEESAPAFAGQAITPALVAERLEQASADPRVGAVVLRVDSPGGAVAASQEITDVIADHPTPVVVSMGDTVASGGYYIATGADEIVAHPGTLTGSIGVIFALIDPSELLDDLGVELEVVTSGEHKDMFVPGRLNEERREMLQAQSDELYQQFVDAIVDGRGMDESAVLDAATGELFTGEEALERGLVDRLGGLREAVDAAAELGGLTDPEVVEHQPSFMDQLFGSSPGGFGLRDALAALLDSTGPTADDPLQRLQHVDELLHTLPEARYEIP